MENVLAPYKDGLRSKITKTEKHDLLRAASGVYGGKLWFVVMIQGILLAEVD